jgi:hypothetical protein
MQIGLWVWTSTAALSAAQNGAQAGSAINGTVGVCNREAAESAREFSLRGVSVDCRISAETVAVTVKASPVVWIPLPGLPSTVEQTATTPRERYTSP